MNTCIQLLKLMQQLFDEGGGSGCFAWGNDHLPSGVVQGDSLRQTDRRVGRDLREPLWIMTDLDAKSALRIYRCRMKIEQAFRDLKNKLGMQGRMSKRQSYMGEV